MIAARIVRNFLLIGLLCSVFTSARAVSAATPDSIDLPSFGVSLTIPKGWVRVSESGTGTIFQLQKQMTTEIKSESSLRMEIISAKAMAAFPTLQIYAEDTAKRVKATVGSDKVTLGGNEAIEFVGGSTPGADVARIVVGRAAKHAGHYYLLYQLSSGSETSREGFDQVAAAIKFVDLQAPSDFIANRDAPMELGKSNLVCAFPDPFRIDKADGNEIFVNAFDFKADKMDVPVTISLMPTAPADFTYFKLLFSAQMERAGYSAPTWIDRADGMVTHTNLMAAKEQAADKPARRIQVVVALSGDGHGVVVSLDFPADKAKKYSRAMVEPLAKSFRAAKSARQSGAKE